MDIQRLISELYTPTTTRSLRRLRMKQCAPSRTKKSKHGIRGAFGGKKANSTRLLDHKNSVEEGNRITKERQLSSLGIL